MYASLMTIILVSIVIPASNHPFLASENPQGSEIIRVTSFDSFICKLDYDKPVTGEPDIEPKITITSKNIKNQKN